MAQDDCLGTWTSLLTPNGGSKKGDGEIEIKKVSNKLKGKHKKDGVDLDDLLCDGAKISFSRVETRPDGTRFRVKYKNGTFSGPTAGKLFINGKYEEVELHADSVDLAKPGAEPARGYAATKGKSDFIDTDTDTGDWQAEKPVVD